MAQLKDLIVTGATRLIGNAYAGTIQITTLNAPTAAGGTTYGPGTNGYVLKSNGSSVYWGSDNNSVTGVKGNAESSYRTGQVNLTAANIGAPTTTGTGASGTWAISITGNAATATAFSSNATVTLTGDATGTSAGSTKSWSVPVTLANSGVTANTYGNTSQQSPSHGGTFNIPYFTVDAKGRLTSAGTTTVKLPADSNTDTKVNVVARGTTKAYVLADTASPPSSAAAHTAVAETGVYLTTTAGQLNATSFKVAEQATIQYNITTSCLEIIV